MNLWQIILIVFGSIIIWFAISIVLYKQFFKRFYDILLSGLALIVLFLPLLLVAFLVKIKLGSPVIFKQERPGKDGKIFNMYKFRTMLPPQTKDGRILTDNERLECIKKNIEILSDEERLTKFGRALRTLSIDELPELWNIFKGDMSIVGPRPLAVIYLPYYTEHEVHRHDVKPGLTGLAQVHGRNTVSWEKKFEYDLKYVNRVSFFGDIKIIIDTFLVVLKHSDIGQGAERPEPFNVVRQREWDNGTVFKDRK